MFEADQFHHQFIDSRTTPNSLPLLLSFPNSNFHASSSAFSTFDSFNSSSSQLNPNFLHSTNSPKIEHKEEQNHTMLPPMNLDTQSERDNRSVDPWSTDELLTLFRIRSSMENWFPDFTWDHVSRKLAEFGFKKSAEMCKEKFEEESRYLNNMNSTTNFPKNYRVFGEFEDLYNSDNNNNNINNNNNNQNPHQVASEKNKKLDKAKDSCQGEEDKIEEQDSKIDQTLIMLDQNNKDSKEEVSDKLKTSGSKRKRDKCSTSSSTTNSSSSNSSSSFEMFKGFCQDIISTIIAQQEQMHNKLLEDMARRDQEKIAREEEWKKQELDRIDKELQLRAQEQVVAGDRQASIINFLNQFASSSNTSLNVEKCSNSNSSTTSSSSSLPILPLNPNPTPNPNQPISSLSSTIDKDSIFSPPKDNPIKPTSVTLPNHNQNPKDSIFSPPKDNPIKPTSITTPNDDQNPKDSIFLPPKENPIKPNSKKHDDQNPNPNPITVTSSNNDHDLGKRWPKDEVLALINLRCSLYNSNEDQEKESSSKTVPLWERISKGMFELGYKRSSKRCKEKWENINKYFRKTKDVNKKRSLDSRTCPYFHQLSTLYSQGKLVNAANSSDLGKSSTTTSNSTLVQVDDKNPVQVSGFEFEF